MPGLIGDGHLYTMPDAEVRKTIAAVIVECEGKMEDIAWKLNYSNRWVTTLIERHRLWPLVNKARIERAEREKREKRHRRR